MENRLWIDDPVHILFGKQNRFFILPDHRDPLSDQVNSFTRFLLVYGSVLSVYHKSWSPIAWTLLFALVVAITVGYMAARRRAFAAAQVPVHAGVIVTPAKPTGDTECVTVTSHNPFANPVVGNDTSIPCKVSDTAMSDQLFVKDLPLNEWDIYGKENSQRQFYSIVNNDQTAFANWLYKTDNTCRDYPTRCMGSYGN